MSKSIIAINFLSQYTVIILFILFFSCISLAQSSESISDSRQTSQGELKIVKEADVGQVTAVKLKDKTVFEPNDYYDAGRIMQVFPKNSPELFLIELTNGSVRCAAKYIIVDLSGKSATTTKEFGNCGDAPVVAYNERFLTVAFTAGSSRDKYERGAKQIWQYRNQKLRKLK